MVLIENLFGIIVFIVFILLRVLGQRKTPPPPRRGHRPPVENQERDWEESRPRRIEPRPQVESPRPVAKSEPEDDDFFPIPDDLREIFGLPPLEKRENRPVQPKLDPEPVIEPIRVVGPGREKDVCRPCVEEPNQKSRARQNPPERKPTMVIPGLGVPMNKESVIQGVIWAEVLNNPRTRRTRRYPGRT